jgi:hypothetical protein
VLDAGLPGELEDEQVALAADVPPLQGREPERPVLLGVDVVADPEVAEVEQPYGERAPDLLADVTEGEVGEHPFPHLRQPASEPEHPVVLLHRSLLHPRGVVDVLAPPGLVAADGLQVAVRKGADPHVGPGRRDHQGLATLGVLRGQPLTALVEEDPALAGPSTGPAGLVGRGTSEPGHGPKVTARPPF